MTLTRMRLINSSRLVVVYSSVQYCNKVLRNCLTATVFGVLGASSISAYFPSGVWYDFYTWQVETDQGKVIKTLPVSDNMPVRNMPLFHTHSHSPLPLNSNQIHIRGGTIIPMHQPAMTTAASRQTPFSLLVALDSSGSATGDLFYDDGESLDMSR